MAKCNQLTPLPFKVLESLLRLFSNDNAYWFPAERKTRLSR